MVTATDGRATAEVRAAVAAVPDPELPVVTIAELGILRDVAAESGRVLVTVTPTYSGCPAMATIQRDIRATLAAHGVADADVRVVLDPPWSTDWITAEGRHKLAEAGIAPPGPAAAAAPGGAGSPVLVPLSVRCPRCGSPDTTQLSRFAATACLSLWRCRSCREPFDRVKEH